jgi:hypothetical protein
MDPDRRGFIPGVSTGTGGLGGQMPAAVAQSMRWQCNQTPDAEMAAPQALNSEAINRGSEATLGRMWV